MNGCMTMDRGILMESIIQINEGDIPSSNNGCFFCEEKAPFTFGIIKSDKIIKSNNTDCFILNSVPLCEKHAEGFNSLLSGEHDINDLITVMKASKQKRINLRR